ncbi:hypothetical protein [Klebsiella sp. WP8-S18-ESBL-06]|uniref:hypothetical protein n=1 Tax=Klebsiella sp. WP8-S18-ESBL-06 TaxID=2675726 RepID=UPI0015DD42F3|nr:hypothetical protein [Klebsiella sp. WP8-S18-ESBL-06]BBT71175.1 hypothetical protein WP8S18E06_24740 [Klebsiella sp. WP8-S18-ESBL-06]
MSKSMFLLGGLMLVAGSAQAVQVTEVMGVLQCTVYAQEANIKGDILQKGLNKSLALYKQTYASSNLGVPTGDDLATGFAEFYQSMGISYAYSNIETALLNKGLSLGGPQWATEARNLFNQGNCELVLGK